MSDIEAKANKIASAVYLITSFFHDHEPLKWKLRGLSTELVSNNVKDKLSVAKEISAFCLLAKNAGLISEVNSGIVAGELSRFSEEAENTIGLKAILNSASEKIGLSKDAGEAVDVKDKIKNKGLSYAPVLTARVSSKPAEGSRSAEERSPSTNTELLPASSALKQFGVVSVKKNSRQSVIIGILKRKKEVMIRDVAPLIAGCSEKTIQRELLAMVASGILKKTGEKRWSRYSLAQPE